MPNRELILLALDDSPILSLMKRALQAVDYGVVSVNEQGGLEKALAESSPALLLIGESFDHANGIEIGRLQLERFPTLPVLLFSEKESLTTIKAGWTAGLSGILSAPLRTDDIVQAVERALTRATYLGDWLRREVRRTTDSLEKRTRISEAERARLESVIAGIDDGIIVLDPEKNLLLINPAAREVFGLNLPELAGQPVESLIPHADLQAMLAKSRQGEIKYFELNFDDGRVFKAELAPIPQIGSAITLQDITDLKRLDQAKSDFVHTISHDLRSPLTAVLGYAELVERVGPLNERQQEFIRRIQTSVQHITALVNELLDLGRLESGFDTRRETIQLESILQYSLGLLEPLIAGKNLQLRREVAASLPALRANPLRIRQMIDNLVGNAIKYAPEGSEVRVCVRAEGPQIIFQVTDTGPGIPRDEQAHVFEKFYRARNVGATKGSGLGLTIVKSVVDGYNGRVWVESVEGHGASFFVVLPALTPGEVQPAEHA